MKRRLPNFLSVVVMALLFGAATVAAQSPSGLRINPGDWLFPIEGEISVERRDCP